MSAVELELAFLIGLWGEVANTAIVLRSKTDKCRLILLKEIYLRLVELVVILLRYLETLFR